MPIERAQAQGCDGNITICHVLQKKAILHLKWPKVSYSFSLSVRTYERTNARTDRLDGKNSDLDDAKQRVLHYVLSRDTNNADFYHFYRTSGNTLIRNKEAKQRVSPYSPGTQIILTIITLLPGFYDCYHSKVHVSFKF